MPAELVARHARTSLLFELKRADAVPQAAALAADLQSGRWVLDRGWYEDYARETTGWMVDSRLVPDQMKMALSEAVTILADERPWEPPRPADGRRALWAGGQSLLCLWQSSGDTARVPLVPSTWIRESSPVWSGLNVTLAIVDTDAMMLPRKDGYDVCRELRRAGVMTPILMVTARTQEAEKVMGLDVGADDYLTKPYGRHELRARVRALLRRAAPATSSGVHRFGDLELDVGRAQVRRGGVTIPLTALELKLMTAFAKGRGRVFTRQQLLDAAWGADVAITERVVDNQIMNLRRKIEADSANPRHIVGVRGLGYRFDA